MIFRDNYSQAPGHCRICTTSNRPVIDTERDYDSDGFGGVLYICHTCGTEIARLFGWVSPDRIEDLEDELARVSERLDEQETENADLAAQVEAFNELVKIVTPETTAKRGPGRPRKTA